jgi:hypothetical protein
MAPRKAGEKGEGSFFHAKEPSKTIKATGST